jgi:hypothetical protein
LIFESDPLNTPAHLVVNLAVLGRLAPGRAGPWIAAGALLPDLPMLAFYAWQRFALRTSEHQIWGSAYFELGWQQFFDTFNSVPIFAALGLLALALRQSGPAWLCGSVLLHALGDAFLHREDGHRHLWPLSNWRFESPVSYWDPAHHGALGAGFETLLILVSTLALWSHASRVGRGSLMLLCALSATGWVLFYGLGYAPPP